MPSLPRNRNHRSNLKSQRKKKLSSTGVATTAIVIAMTVLATAGCCIFVAKRGKLRN